ncbi:MAG: sigma-70 family RNA polymerase sigma factor [Planctomycetes bacterium]|nr:sigma-70 family RNA polymerase sigma factor [Planctomycetota bacterium]
MARAREREPESGVAGFLLAEGRAMTDAAFRSEELAGHAEFVRRLARSLLVDGHDAEDVAQETARVALEHPPRGTEVRGWFAAVARRVLGRERRSAERRRRREEDAARPEAQPAAERALEREETVRRVVRAVGALPEPYRVVVTMRFYDDLPPREIAKRLGLPVETVRTRVRRAVERLRIDLTDEANSSGVDWKDALAVFVAPDSIWASATASTAPWLVVFAGCVVSLAAWFVWRADTTATVPVVVAHGEDADDARSTTGSSDLELAAATSPSSSETERVAAVSRGVTVSGHVRDRDGVGLAGARVCVGGERDPFEADHPAPRIAWDSYVGRWFSTRDDGSWSAELPSPGRVQVELLQAPNFEVIGRSRSDGWIDAPASNVDFSVRRITTATVAVRVLRGGSREPLRDFGVSLHGDPGPECEHRAGGPTTYTLGYFTARAQGEVATFTFRLEAPEGRWCRVALFDELAPAQSVLVRPAERRELSFVVPDGDCVSGVVVDHDGNAIDGALVFFGDRTTGRGDEPFRPFDASRIVGGVKTAADGWFELEGSGSSISAWHADHSQTTVAAAAAGRIVLGPLGALLGRVVDPAGRPLPGAVVELDRRGGDVRAVADAVGRFAFERVEAGTHGLFVELELCGVVRLEAGARDEIELVAGPGSATLEFFAAGAPQELGSLHALLIGQERVGDLAGVRLERLPAAPTNELVVGERLLAGSYLLVTDLGWSARFDLRDDRARVELGAAKLRVFTASSGSVQAVPAESDEFTRLAAARVRVRPDESGVAHFVVAPGRWTIVGERGAVFGEVDVPLEGAELRLH